MQVLRYMPITPRIKQMFLVSSKAKLLDAHVQYRSNGEILNGIFDGEAMKQFEYASNHDFAAEPRNLKFMLASDGIQPFSQRSTNNSVWPVTLINCNLPPHLAIKSAFMITCLIIPGKKQVKNFDTYLRPLLDEFKSLWSEGIMVHDSSRPHEGEFRLRAMLFSTLHDYPGLSVVSGICFTFKIMLYYYIYILFVCGLYVIKFSIFE